MDRELISKASAYFKDHKLVSKWLDTPFGSLDGMTPVAFYKSSEQNRESILAYLDSLIQKKP